MKYNELSLTSNRGKRRVGRGISAGQGKTAGRGTKGQGARSGTGGRKGFEGGQNPITQRLPKIPGFKSKRPKAEIIYTSQLETVGKSADNFSLFELGLLSSPYTVAKVIVRGELTKAVSVKLQGASAGAIETIKKAGGSFDATPRVMRAKKSEKENNND
jgi:large subunit ribosomal protein L15